MDEERWSHPAVYALQCALTAYWSSVGVTPTVAVGQGFGELAAAQAAGVFSLEDGMKVATAVDSHTEDTGYLALLVRL